MPLCLVVEDQPSQRRLLTATLGTAGYQVASCGSGSEAVDLIGTHRPEVVLLDLGLPDTDGIDLVPGLLAVSPLSRIVVLTGRDSVRHSVAALQAGARHYLVKPWDRNELLVVVQREAAAVTREEAARRSMQPGEQVFWGDHPEMARIRQHVERLREAPSTAVLILGATGTGKEVIARRIHEETAPPGAFVSVNCSAVPTELMESELFGHERGAFTGAEKRRRGVVELAEDGTLFLDEIGDMAPHLQAKLLRFLQDGRFRRLGGETELESECRVVAATNAPLDQRIQAGGFRADLYYRLSVVQLHLPTLAERAQDILPLTHFLLERVARRMGRRPRQLSPRAESALLHHDWPGNVRELANRLERALVLGAGDRLEAEDLDLEPDHQVSFPTAKILDDPALLRQVLEAEGWNVARTARRLGVARHKLRYRIEKAGLAGRRA